MVENKIDKLHKYWIKSKFNEKLINMNKTNLYMQYRYHWATKKNNIYKTLARKNQEKHS